MKDIFDATLILFDFDGVLVNTEKNHYLAYKMMAADRGFELDWDFMRYCQAAHYSSAGLESQIYSELPALHKQESDWSVLYAEKKFNYSKLIDNGGVELMPGVEAYLKYLEDKGVNTCVVTHSSLEHIEIIRKKLPVLNSINHWITREDYGQPKPSSECYLSAIKKFANINDKIIGYEDTPRGLQALMGTPAQAILVCQIEYPEIDQYINKGAQHYSSFEEILGKKD